MIAPAAALALAVAGAFAATPDHWELSWRQGRDLIRRGEGQAGKAERLVDFLEAESVLKRSVASSPASAEAHFWLDVAMGRRGETQGILKSIFLIAPIRREMQETLRLDPGHGGAHRVLGEILWQVPGIAGGDKKKAIEEFEAAVRLSPNNRENYLPLARAYMYFGRKKEAAGVLKALESVPAPVDPER